MSVQESTPIIKQCRVVNQLGKLKAHPFYNNILNKNTKNMSVTPQKRRISPRAQPDKPAKNSMVFSLKLTKKLVTKVLGPIVLDFSSGLGRDEVIKKSAVKVDKTAEEEAKIEEGRENEVGYAAGLLPMYNYSDSYGISAFSMLSQKSLPSTFNLRSIAPSLAIPDLKQKSSLSKINISNNQNIMHIKNKNIQDSSGEYIDFDKDQVYNAKPKATFCQICRQPFEDYIQHITHFSHVSRIKKNYFDEVDQLMSNIQYGFANQKGKKSRNREKQDFTNKLRHNIFESQEGAVKRPRSQKNIKDLSFGQDLMSQLIQDQSQQSQNASTPIFNDNSNDEKSQRQKPNNPQLTKSLELKKVRIYQNQGQLVSARVQSSFCIKIDEDGQVLDGSADNGSKVDDNIAGQYIDSGKSLESQKLSDGQLDIIPKPSIVSQDPILNNKADQLITKLNGKEQKEQDDEEQDDEEEDKNTVKKLKNSVQFDLRNVKRHVYEQLQNTEKPKTLKVQSQIQVQKVQPIVQKQKCLKSNISNLDQNLSTLQARQNDQDQNQADGDNDLGNDIDSDYQNDRGINDDQHQNDPHDNDYNYGHNYKQNHDEDYQYLSQPNIFLSEEEELRELEAKFIGDYQNSSKESLLILLSNHNQ